MAKNRRLNEPLVLCATLDASMRIQEAAKVLHDERLQVAVQGVDLIAMDVVYHTVWHCLACMPLVVAIPQAHFLVGGRRLA